MTTTGETTAMSDREALARVLYDADMTEPYTDAEWAVVWPESPDSRMNRRIDAILASDWLRERDPRLKAEALREAADFLQGVASTQGMLLEPFVLDVLKARADEIGGAS